LAKSYEDKEKTMQILIDRYLKAKRKLFQKAYAKMLNTEQRRAVFTVNGPLIVLAGAGSGKTTVLVNRIAFIIKYGDAYFSDYVPSGISEDDVLRYEEALNKSPDEILEILSEFTYNPCPPYSVLAITFTNKAANEMKERLAKAFGDSATSDAIWAGTFHSVCLKILRKFGESVGYRQGFSIYDQDDSKRLISACMKELSIDEKRLAPRACQTEISKAKDKLITPDKFVLGYDPRSKDILEIYKLYQKKLMENNAVDFDDIIMKTVELLQSDDEVREYYQNKFKYVLVDE
jgi:DNA helicase-2/ATP-dependent DNA helicase PcrA